MTGAAAAATAAEAADRRHRRRRGCRAVSRAVHAQREVLDRRLVDLRQRAEALAGVVARIRRPRIGERLLDRFGIEAWLIRTAACWPAQQCRATSTRTTPSETSCRAIVI